MKGTAPGNAAELPIHRVDIVEPGVPARQRHIRCEIGENLQFDTAGLEAYCFANWDARVFDAFVLAAAVQFCDHTKTRPSARWGREIILRVPVHDPAHWRSAAVSEALQRALEFLTGDRWHIEFVARKRPEAPAPTAKPESAGRRTRRYPVQRRPGLAGSRRSGGTRARPQAGSRPVGVAVAQRPLHQRRQRALCIGAVPCAHWLSGVGGIERAFARVQVCAAERDRGISVARPAGDPARKRPGSPWPGPCSCWSGL